MGKTFQKIVDLAMILFGIYTIFTQEASSQTYLIGYIFVMWGALGSRIGRIEDENRA